MKAPLPPNEQQRLTELDAYSILDTEPEQAFDDITLIASHICDCPVALVSLVDADRQWFKSNKGLSVSETPRDLAFCAHTILDPSEVLVVTDATRDERFANNPLVTAEAGIRFYAGAPLVTDSGCALGTLCVIDHESKTLEAEQQHALEALARQVVAQLALRKTLTERENYLAQLEGYQKRLEQNLSTAQEDSLTDSLTQLANRRAFLDAMDLQMLRLNQNQSPTSIALIDVDHFKAYNDDLGHSAGDDALREISKRLQRECRASDLVARYGGEEFIALLANTDAVGARVMAERMRRAIESADWPLRPVTVSVGLASWTQPEGDAAALIALADEALYRSKKDGRNRVSVATPTPPIDEALAQPKIMNRR